LLLATDSAIGQRDVATVVKILFAGPSLHRVAVELEGIQLRPPAGQGDLARAVIEGATAIGLVDGVFGERAAVWHKEILFALTEGVRVLGSSSMGALRAAECHAFGMRPVGVIAERYLSGELDDDAAVALQMAPAELDYGPLVDALVDIEATVDNLEAVGAADRQTADRLRTAARSLYFGDRTPERVVDAAGLIGEGAALLTTAFHTYRISQKERDAVELIAELKRLPDKRDAQPTSWTMATPRVWNSILAELRSTQPS